MTLPLHSVVEELGALDAVYPSSGPPDLRGFHDNHHRIDEPYSQA